MGPPKCWAPGNCPVCPPLEPALIMVSDMYMYIIHKYDNNPQYDTYIIYMQSCAVSPIQYLLRQKISIVDTFIFVFVSIIKITKLFLIVSISHK